MCELCTLITLLKKGISVHNSHKNTPKSPNFLSAMKYVMFYNGSLSLRMIFNFLLKASLITTKWRMLWTSLLKQETCDFRLKCSWNIVIYLSYTKGGFVSLSHYKLMTNINRQRELLSMVNTWRTQEVLNENQTSKPQDALCWICC